MILFGVINNILSNPRVKKEDHQKSELEVNNMPTWMTTRSKTTTFLVDKPTKPLAFLFSVV